MPERRTALRADGGDELASQRTIPAPESQRRSEAATLQAMVTLTSER
jgi:hypothetical protein